MRDVANRPTSGAGAIACFRREAALAAREILQQGGNALDAAVAALLVEFVIAPSYAGLGGYGGSFVYLPGQNEKSPRGRFDRAGAAKLDLAALNKSSANHGPLAVGVPGNVAGIDLALREFGTMPFGTVAKRAIEIAEQGTPVTPGLSAKFAALKNIDPVSRRAYFPDGVPAVGGTWKQPDLARLMRRLCEDGPSSFYTSDVAATICKQLQAGGGTLTAEDFHDFRVKLEEPLHVRYRGYDLYTPPLPSGGLTCLSTLKTLEQFDLAEYKPVSAGYYNLFFDAANLAWAERDRYFGDPEFVKVPIEDLLSEKRAMENASTIRKGDVKTKPVRRIAQHTR